MIGRLGPKLILAVVGCSLVVAVVQLWAAPGGSAPAVSGQPSWELAPGDLLPGGEADLPRVTFAGSFTLQRGMRIGRLNITASLAPGWHIYSTTQAAGGPRRTILAVAASPDYQLTGAFVADRDPVVRFESVFPGIALEEYDTEVTWSVPIELAESVDPQQLLIDVTINGQLCLSDGACDLVSDQRVRASFAGYEDPAQHATEFRSEDGHITITGHLQPKVVEPGDTVHLVLTAQLADKWHVYAWAPMDPKKVSKPTLIVLRKTSGMRYGVPKPSAEPRAEPSGLPEEPVVHYHEGTVSWTVPLQVPREAQWGSSFEVLGSLGFQTCTPTSCDLPAGVDFRGEVVVDKPMAGMRPLTFTPGNYAEIAKLAAAREEARKKAKSSADAAQGAADAGRGVWADKSVLTVLGLAFVAGLILNVMPCVLPVIGLKIMSFVQQAGGSRREILALNLWFSLGLLCVFWILAGAAAFAHRGWGEHFGNVGFTVTMIGVVFAFGLSFLGVWEIPIPGFVATGAVQDAAQREGAVGAFSKGALSTVLATPCAGPLLVPAVSWAIAQPPWLTFGAFTSIGLGMASPYLLIGAFPHLINILPRPGAWMDTFKQLMGFLLMGTVVFLFNSLEATWIMPSLTLLLGIGFGCWLLGRTPMTAAFSTRLRGWVLAASAVAAAAGIGFVGLVPQEQLEWIPYTRLTLDQQLAAGRTVLVDFTASWCLTCRTNETFVLNTTEVARLVRQNGVVTIKADKTQSNPEIDALLVELGNPGRGIPYYAIYPGRGGDPITFDGLISQQQVLDALQRAGPSRSEQLAETRAAAAR